MAVVIYNEGRGVYLGEFLGLAFWSKLDPAGQTAAPVFPSVMYAEIVLKTLGFEKGKYYFVEVKTDGANGHFASIEACVRAGLPGWTPSENEVDIKFKRRLRDHFNKNIHDRSTLEKVASAIGYGKLHVNTIGYCNKEA